MLSQDDLAKFEALIDRKFQEKLAPVYAQIHGQAADLYRLNVLFEDLDDRVRAQNKYLGTCINAIQNIPKHEVRLRVLEEAHETLKRTVREHARKLQAA